MVVDSQSVVTNKRKDPTQNGRGTKKGQKGGEVPRFAQGGERKNNKEVVVRLLQPKGKRCDIVEPEQDKK